MSRFMATTICRSDVSAAGSLCRGPYAVERNIQCVSDAENQRGAGKTMIIRWTKGKPYVYESMMAYDYGRQKDVQKYEYLGSYAAWRKDRWDKSYLDDVLKPYQALSLTDRQRETLTKIDMRSREQGRKSQ